jgi:uncharacterized protein (DUF433 family)
MRDYELLQRIILNPSITGGKPIIKGTRLTVDYILGLLAYGTTEEEISQNEGITREDIRACLLFAAKSLETTFFMPLPAMGAA